MTAQPDHTDFSTRTAAGPETVVMRPKVVEHYWGYEVASNEHVISAAVLMRAMCGLLTVATFGAAIGVWLVPAMAFVGSAFVSKLVVSVMLLAVMVVLARIAARGTQVRVQVDMTTGELREVVDGPFGSVITLANYGIDAVQSVDIVSSRTEPSFGQIHVQISGLGPIPVGDGAILTLHPLRDRLAQDCGVDQGDSARVAVWGGPLAA
ncbi:hypothetical protein L0664_14195 [Octadecabacter sp. G9-8]|uniref:DUF304 domain-containing protein n=1 Tax=Octadecabacter dasysiphoniae TaxID=2909341 RepID=A0ABS9CYT2_9RHOB|nr:hypothetical protein [Octadecabacter dasysiphoniae]MCF2872222.1 hypothetical protein [Octadecabacter dasysiphoniae]